MHYITRYKFQVIVLTKPKAWKANAVKSEELVANVTMFWLSVYVSNLNSVFVWDFTVLIFFKRTIYLSHLNCVIS